MPQLTFQLLWHGWIVEVSTASLPGQGTADPSRGELTCERPLAPCGTPLTQSPAMKTLEKEVVCSGRLA